LYFGYLSLVDGMIDRISAELGTRPRVIATGGLAELFGGGSEKIEQIDPLLTLKGLRLIDERNRGG
ncbi:MAG TPA: pantothenate kinase, partial [Thermoanaerobaculia bacterium]